VLSPIEGVLDRTFFNPGDIPKVGDLIAVMNVELLLCTFSYSTIDQI
jgi:hypothetical protein